jgi:hypothetical protein
LGLECSSCTSTGRARVRLGVRVQQLHEHEGVDDRQPVDLKALRQEGVLRVPGGGWVRVGVRVRVRKEYCAYLVGGREWVEIVSREW